MLMGSVLQTHGGNSDGPSMPYGLIAMLASGGAVETAYLTMVRAALYLS